jgi:hypothetical protein
VNTQEPHDIVPSDVFKKMFEAPKPESSVYDYVMLDPKEAELLMNKTPEERRVWMDENLPSWERLARFLEFQEAPDFMVKRARDKVYSDFDSSLEMPCVQLIKDCKALQLHRVVEAAKTGAFDATSRESNEWADRQDGEVKAVLDQMRRGL